MEEEMMKKHVMEIRSSGKFNPIEYGQDKNLAGCKFARSIQQLSLLDTFKTPFEKIACLRSTHKQIATEIDEYTKMIKLPKIALNEDIVIASLMTVFVYSNVEHPIVNTLIIQYFCYVDYSIGEAGKCQYYNE